MLYWILTEQAGGDDLRFYGLVHFYPMALIPLLLRLFPPRYSRGQDVLVVLVLYGAALGAVQAGDIVLMPDGGRGINHPDELVKVLPEFLSNLSRRGLVPSRLSE